MTTPRGEILEQARKLTEGDREDAYGSPVPNMECFGLLVEAYLSVRMPALLLTSVDGAIIACLLKISRIAANQQHMDSYTDLAAYAAIAGECAQYRGEEK